jgi:hypothetical protein
VASKKEIWQSEVNGSDLIGHNAILVPSKRSTILLNTEFSKDRSMMTRLI